MPASYAASLQHTYADIAECYDEVTYAKMLKEELHDFVTMVGPQSDVLDLGCGPGRDARYLVDHGMNVTLFDLSDELLSIAKKRVPTATIVQGDMTALPFADHSFDGIWANASLLHLTKAECAQVLARLHRVLRPNGVLFCSFKQGSGERELVEDKYGKPVARFFSFYTADELHEILITAGLKVDAITEIGKPPRWLHAFTHVSQHEQH